MKDSFPGIAAVPLRLMRKAEPLVFSGMRLVPFAPQKLLLENLLKQLLLEPMADGDLDFLTGRVLRIFVTDAGIGWRISYTGEQLEILPPAGAFDAAISGGIRAFLLLASRQEDPDSLFFRRKLCIEGDTELGLEAKNLLDSVELERLPLPVQHALQGAGKLAALSST